MFLEFTFPQNLHVNLVARRVGEVDLQVRDNL
jgi:hypothetical protein